MISKVTFRLDIESRNKVQYSKNLMLTSTVDKRYTFKAWRNRMMRHLVYQAFDIIPRDGNNSTINGDLIMWYRRKKLGTVVRL